MENGENESYKKRSFVTVVTNRMENPIGTDSRTAPICKERDLLERKRVAPRIAPLLDRLEEEIYDNVNAWKRHNLRELPGVTRYARHKGRRGSFAGDLAGHCPEPL